MDEEKPVKLKQYLVMQAILATGLLLASNAHTSNLVDGDADAGKAKSTVCAACHGADGNSLNPQWPSLAGQHSRYSYEQLMLFKAGERNNVLMNGQAMALSEQDMKDLSAYFEAQTPVVRQVVDPESTNKARRLYRGGDAERGIPACIACHGPTGKGNPGVPYPSIGGQHATYIASSLREYALDDDKRSNTETQNMMTDIAMKLAPDEIDALASYLQGLRIEPERSDNERNKRTSIFVLLMSSLAACGNDDTVDTEQAAAVVETAETVETAPATEAPAAEEQLAAVEESDGSYDADAVAKEGSLRLAQSSTEAAPQRFTEGKHFDRFRPTKMTVNGGEKIEVAEVFWYGCNHCYNLEPILQRWAEDLPEGVEFVKLPAVWNPVLETHAQVFFTIEALAGAGKIENKNAVHMAFFDEIHVNRQRMSSEKSIIDFIGNFGVDKASFENAWNSFEVNTKLRQAKTLNRAYEIGSVPTIVVNGKYVTDETRAGGKPELIAVIDELIASER